MVQHSEQTIERMKLAARRRVLRQGKRTATPEEVEQLREKGRKGAAARWTGVREAPEARLARRREYGRKYRAARPGYGSNLHQSNPVYFNFLTARSKIKNRGIETNFVYDDWLRIKRFYGYRCLACDATEPAIKVTVDHIIPLSKGGSDEATNIQPLCGSCNSAKRDKSHSFLPLINHTTRIGDAMTLRSNH